MYSRSVYIYIPSLGEGGNPEPLGQGKDSTSLEKKLESQGLQAGGSIAFTYLPAAEVLQVTEKRQCYTHFQEGKKDGPGKYHPVSFTSMLGKIRVEPPGSCARAQGGDGER